MATTSLNGLHPTKMRPRVEAVLADPEAKGMGLFVVSAFRSIERQRVLFAAAVKKYGSEKAARKWVAPPGKSNHGPALDDAGNKVNDQLRYGKWGGAVDLGVPGLAAVSGQWPTAIERKVNAICARHGLYSPMAWEDWHFEVNPDWQPVVVHAASPAPAVLNEEDPLHMDIAKDTADARHEWVRRTCLTHWGYGVMTAADQDYLVKQIEKNGLDLTLAEIVDHSRAATFRKNRGW